MKNSNSSYRTTSVQCVVRITSELKPHGATRLTARRSYRGRTPHARPSVLKEQEKCSAVDTHPNRRPRPASRGRTAARRKPKASRYGPPSLHPSALQRHLQARVIEAAVHPELRDTAAVNEAAEADVRRLHLGVRVGVEDVVPADGEPDAPLELVREVEVEERL